MNLSLELSLMPLLFQYNCTKPGVFTVSGELLLIYFEAGSKIQNRIGVDTLRREKERGEHR